MAVIVVVLIVWGVISASLLKDRDRVLKKTLSRYKDLYRKHRAFVRETEDDLELLEYLVDSVSVSYDFKKLWINEVWIPQDQVLSERLQTQLLYIMDHSEYNYDDAHSEKRVWIRVSPMVNEEIGKYE